MIEKYEPNMKNLLTFTISPFKRENWISNVLIEKTHTKPKKE
jgi:hypothetical protein